MSEVPEEKIAALQHRAAKRYSPKTLKINFFETQISLSCATQWTDLKNILGENFSHQGGSFGILLKKIRSAPFGP